MSRKLIIIQHLSNNKGIALITSLLMTLISLLIIMSVMTLITGGIKRTGAQKRYKTAIEATYGGADIVLKEIMPYVLQNIGSGGIGAAVQGQYEAGWLSVTTDQCLTDKLTKVTGLWNAACSQTLNPKPAPDFSFSLTSQKGQPYTVYTKIVDTTSGNTDTSGLQLEGAGVAESTSVLTPLHQPYVYRLEVQGERSVNATEQSNVSILYAY